MPFDDPYIPDVNNILAQHGRGFAVGTEMRQQNALGQAGKLLAGGDRKGAVNALYEGGQVDAGLKIEEHFRQAARQADADKLAKAERFQRTLGNLAMLADTPEKWTAAINAAKQAGLDVDKWADFGTRDYVIAQAGKANEVLALELNRRKVEATAAAKARPKPRTLSFGDTQKLADKGVQYENIKRYGGDFEDKYAGYGRGGETAMWTARNLPFLTGETTEKAAGFWQDYDRYKNQVRNDLFGSALTASEKQAFEAADISPNMSPKLIRENLAKQQAATKSALAKIGKSLVSSGYAPEAVEGALGVPLEELGVSAPASSGNAMGVGGELDETTLGDLPEGAVIRDENGQRYMRQGDQLVPVE